MSAIKLSPFLSFSKVSYREERQTGEGGREGERWRKEFLDQFPNGSHASAKGLELHPGLAHAWQEPKSFAHLRFARHSSGELDQTQSSPETTGASTAHCTVTPAVLSLDFKKSTP